MNLDITKPGIVIVSSSSTKPKSLIKLITRSTPIESVADPHIVSQDWEINTKYYTANVQFYGITEDYIRTTDFNNSIEAFIIHMDSNKASGLSELDKWTSYEHEFDAEVKLLISNYFTPNTKISKPEATKWCLKRGFELIELYPTADNSTVDTDDSAIIEEKTGVERVIEALQTHVWPNLNMKSRSTSTEHQEKLKKLGADFADLENPLENPDDFTELFSQLSTLKQSLTSMSGSQRKQNAEVLVTKFWQAIGGDEDELM